MPDNLNSQHPEYAEALPDWKVMEDVYKGQRTIKQMGNTYLPYTSGQIELGITKETEPGFKLYDAYRKRAYFPEIVRDTVNALVGAMTREPANIQLPDRLEEMRERATPKGETLNVLHKRILENQLLFGRRGLMADVDETRDVPYIIDFSHRQIRNWDDVNKEPGTAERKLIMVILDESRQERENLNNYNWMKVERFRLLTLGTNEEGTEPGNTYMTQLDVQGSLQDTITPMIAGRTLDEIPFVFINTMDLIPKIGEVPLLDLGHLNLTIYRAEADYRQTLFMTGQDTLVITGVQVNNEGLNDPGASNPVVIGNGAMINIPDPEGDAKFIGVDGQGLSEQRESLQNDYERAADFGLKLLSSGSGVEAADTMRMRVAGKTANLATVSMTAAAGLQEILRICARWVGANEDDVVVEPNLDFVQDAMGAEELLKLVMAKSQGAPLSWQSIHNQMRRKDLTEMTFDEEQDALDQEPDMNFVQRREERADLELGIGENDDDDNDDDDDNVDDDDE